MIRQIGAGGLLGLSNTFRAMSPFQQAADLAHRVARHRLEAGGAPGPSPNRAKADLAPRDFVLPLDVDAAEVRKAIEAKLGASPQPTDAPPILERKAGGRVAISGYHVLRLGDGRFDLGRRFLHGLVKQVRAGRVRRKTTVA